MFFDTNNVLAPSSPVIPTSVGVAIVAAYALDLAKRIKAIPKISYYSTKLNSWIRLATAGLGTLGVSWSWAAYGTGHQLLITIPAWSVIGAYLWHAAIAFGVQHLAEIQLAQRPDAQKAMVEQAKVEPKDLPGKTPVGPVTTTAVGQPANVDKKP
jgi:hypothetical protein